MVMWFWVWINSNIQETNQKYRLYPICSFVYSECWNRIVRIGDSHWHHVDAGIRGTDWSLIVSVTWQMALCVNIAWSRVYSGWNKHNDNLINIELKSSDKLQTLFTIQLYYIRFVITHPLTHWGRDEMAAISQTTLSDAFSGMKMYEIRLRIHWSLFLRFESTIFKHWFR